MIEQIKELLLWARAERIQIGRLKFAELELELVDLELVADNELLATKKQWTPAQAPADPADLYAELARQRGMNVERSDLVEENDA